MNLQNNNELEKFNDKIIKYDSSIENNNNPLNSFPKEFTL